LTEDDPDADLLARVGRGEEQAARELVARKLPRLLALAARLLGRRGEAEEVAQEVFVRAWQQAGRWQPGPARFDTWLHRVALNLCYDRCAAAMTRPAWTKAMTCPILRRPRKSNSTQAGAGDRVAAALAALPVRQREAVVLQYYQEFSNTEAADMMGISVEALESLLARARRTLRARLAGSDGKEGQA
jgi:RNA polymerase sigma-70 factor (ECF subfamily)